MSSNDIKINGKEYTRASILKVGRNLASIWGGECSGFSVDEESNEINFDCIEAGEEFAVTQTFDEMETQLNNPE